MSHTTVKKLNNLVSTFLSENEGVENLETNWLTPTIQKQIKSLFSNKGDSRKHKDPNAPKRGKSAYLWFCSDHRDNVKKDLGNDAKATDITTELGLRWNQLKNDKKRAKELTKYEKLASEDKIRYESEKTQYVPPVNDGDDGRKKRKKADKTGPKRAKSAYLYFCDEKRNSVKASNPEMKATDVTTKLGQLWNELKSDGKRSAELKKYEALAAEDKNRYESEKEVPSASETKSKASKKKAAPAAPKKGAKTEQVKAPAKSAAKGKKKAAEVEEVVDEPSSSKKGSKGQNTYQAFVSFRRNELKQENPKMKPAEITKKISDEWKEMSAEEKENWKQ